MNAELPTHNPLAGFRHRLLDRLRDAFISLMQHDGDDCTGLHIHRLLGLVSQMRAPIFPFPVKRWQSAVQVQIAYLGFLPFD